MTTYLSDLQISLHQIFDEDQRVLMLGEDLADPYGGAFKVSKGLTTKYPERVLSTPICEAGITGVAAGLAIRGMRPIVEIMFGDFLTLCADQIVNHICKFSGMYPGVTVPLVIRTPMGGGRGYGATHSQTLEKMFLGIPNLHVVAPSHAHSPGQLLRQATLHDNDPVLFIENKLLYPLPLISESSKLHVKMVAEISGYPTAIISNFTGAQPDVTLIAYGGLSRMIAPIMERFADEEINLTCILPSSLRPVPVNTLINEIHPASRVLIVEEGTAGFNWGSEIAALLYENAFDKLTQPVRRMASEDSIIPSAGKLEDAALISESKIENTILEVLA
ncbi:MAG TPA: transketolase C-terminal domain-containing protein [Noviherbaspirillum sp.]|nr:transketolase C-terminal domain-containing protein [Noviherbaspirillum sp.]